MPSSEMRRPRLHAADAEYSYRRQLSLREMLPAIGIGIGAGLFAYYVTRLLMQRTPLRVDRGRPVGTVAKLDRAKRELTSRP